MILVKSNSQRDVLNTSRPQLSRQSSSVRRSSLVKKFGEIVSGSYPGGTIINGGASKNKIRSYIRNGLWSKLRRYLTSEEGCYEVSQLIAQPDDDQESDWTILHEACRYFPPCDIIQKLCSLNPRWVFNTKNPEGHNALHVASAFGAHPTVVAFLCSLDPDLASIKDSQGKTSLHLHCDSCCDAESCDPSCWVGQDSEDENEEIDDLQKIVRQYQAAQNASGPILKVIEILHAASPRSVNEEDARGMNPIEYCLIRNASRKAVIMMQKMSVIEWRKDERNLLANIGRSYVKGNNRNLSNQAKTINEMESEASRPCSGAASYAPPKERSPPRRNSFVKVNDVMQTLDEDPVKATETNQRPRSNSCTDVKSFSLSCEINSDKEDLLKSVEKVINACTKKGAQNNIPNSNNMRLMVVSSIKEDLSDFKIQSINKGSFEMDELERGSKSKTEFKSLDRLSRIVRRRSCEYLEGCSIHVIGLDKRHMLKQCKSLMLR